MKMGLHARILITMSKKPSKEIISEVHDDIKKESEGFSNLDGSTEEESKKQKKKFLEENNPEPDISAGLELDHLDACYCG
jgi:hypothetical protein